MTRLKYKTTEGGGDGLDTINGNLDELAELIVKGLRNGNSPAEEVDIQRQQILKDLSSLLYDVELAKSPREVIETEDLVVLAYLREFASLCISRMEMFDLDRSDIEYPENSFSSRGYSADEARRILEGIFNEGIERYVELFRGFEGTIVFNRNERNNEGQLVSFTMYEGNNRPRTYYFHTRNYSGDVFDGIAFRSY